MRLGWDTYTCENKKCGHFEQDPSLHDIIERDGGHLKFCHCNYCVNQERDAKDNGSTEESRYENLGVRRKTSTLGGGDAGHKTQFEARRPARTFRDLVVWQQPGSEARPF